MKYSYLQTRRETGLNIQIFISLISYFPEYFLVVMKLKMLLYFLVFLVSSCVQEGYIFCAVSRNCSQGYLGFVGEEEAPQGTGRMWPKFKAGWKRKWEEIQDHGSLHNSWSKSTKPALNCILLKLYIEGS